MILLVSMRLAPSTTYYEERDAISHDWGRLLEDLNVTPVLVPNSLRNPARTFDEFRPNGILLTGGDDLGGGPSEFGRQTSRDRTEFALVAEALSRDVPILAVCRGLHVLNAFLDGRLTRSVDEPHVAVDHAVTLLAPLGGRPEGSVVEVNSFHNHGVHLDGLARALRPVAVTAGGFVEALEFPEHRTLAIQWHPERKSPDPRFAGDVFRQWLDRCA